MKRIYASLGVAALGVAGIQCVQGQSSDPSRSWSASASLRGFYDDNVNTVPSEMGQTESFGFEVSPSLSFTLPLEQTSISGGYTYAYKWYEKAVNGRTDHDDHTHTLAARLRHTFSERLVMSVQDSFVVGQEPDILRVGNTADASLQRIPGDNIRNYGAINFNAQVTRLFGLEVGYANALFDYSDNTAGGASARLDRLDHAAHVDGRWNIQRDTVAIVGYQFRWVDYTANLFLEPSAPFLFMSNSRNSRSHYGYVGLEHTFRPDLFATLSGGIRYNDYYNSPDNESGISPYVQATFTYEYAKESRVQIGVSHDRSATDQYSALAASSITLDADTTVAYLSLVHRIVPDLFGSVVGNFQSSTFNGGPLDQDTEAYYGFGVNLEYRFNRHLSANVGYNYDRLDGDYSGGGDRDYDRNRAYIGATVVY